jgi:hypothetical protein
MSETITTKVTQKTLDYAKKIVSLTGEKQYMAIEYAVKRRWESMDGAIKNAKKKSK